MIPAWARRLIGAQVPDRRAGARDPLGPAGERAASRYLRKRGFRTIARNVRIAGGEADLVCLAPDKRTVVLVEVKARRRATGDTRRFGPEGSVTARKQRKLVNILGALCARNGWTDRPRRIDVVAVEWPHDRARNPEIRHFEDAVRARG